MRTASPAAILDSEVELHPFLPSSAQATLSPNTINHDLPAIGKISQSDHRMDRVSATQMFAYESHPHLNNS